MLCGGKCYKMIAKNRGNEVILEMAKALNNKNFEFPRTHLFYGGGILESVEICRCNLQQK